MTKLTRPQLVTLLRAAASEIEAGSANGTSATAALADYFADITETGDLAILALLTEMLCIGDGR